MIIFLLKLGPISIAGGKKGPNTNVKLDYLLLQRKFEPEKFMGNVVLICSNTAIRDNTAALT